MAATLSPPQINEPPGAGHSIPSATIGGRFDFDDGGVYVGGWQDSKAHGHGVCTGPKSQGEYSGSWCYGFELSGVYKWPSGATYEGQWQNGKRHGLGVEYRGKWVYKGEWTQGYKGRYGTRSSLLSAAKYEGTWANGLQDGYGSETYADGGTYQGQWLRGTRHGYGVRQSAAFGHCNITKAALMKNSSTNASMHSLDTEGDGGTLVNHKRDAAMRGGFILVVRSTANKRRNSLVDTTRSTIFKGLRIRKQRSTGDLDQRSGRSSASGGRASSTESGISGSHRGDNEMGDAISNASFLTDEGDIQDPTTTETYMGEWKNDKRCGFGICERSDGIRYEGEWYNNKKYGYGVTTMRDGYREEGKYKNNVLVTNMKKKHLFMIRSSKTRERIEAAVQASRRSQEIALQKADIAISRTATARGKAEQADVAAVVGREDSQLAFTTGKMYGGAEASAFPDVPLRRKMSSVDFSGGRRQTKENIHLLTPAQNPNSLSPDVNSIPKSNQFLDPSMPFGGRRGSFRNHSDSLHPQHPAAQQLPPHLQSQSSSFSQQQQFQQQQQQSLPPHMQSNRFGVNPNDRFQQQQQPQQQPQTQLNVPSLSFEPATPDPGLQFLVPSSQQQQSQQVPSRPLRPSLKLNSSPHNQQMQQQQLDPRSQQQQYSLNQQQQLQFQDQQALLQSQHQQQRRVADERQELYQMQQQQFEQMQRLEQQQQMQMEADRIRRQQFGQQQQHQYQQQMQLSHQQQQAVFQQQMQQQQQQQMQYQLQQQQMSNNNQNYPQQNRRMTITQQQQQQQSYNNSYQQQRMMAEGGSQPFTDHFDHYSALVSRYSNPVKPQLAGKTRSKTPVSSIGVANNPSLANVRSRDSVASSSSKAGAAGNPVTESMRNSMVFDDIGFPGNRGGKAADAISYASSLADGASSPRNSGPMRTTSLIRPAGPTGVTGLKRKPSIQTATLKATQPAMSREEVAAMSHAQRLYNRSEADMAVRMRSNPLLYLVNPRFTEWLNRQKLILIILVLNVSLAIIFYQLFG